MTTMTKKKAPAPTGTNHINSSLTILQQKLFTSNNYIEKLSDIPAWVVWKYQQRNGGKLQKPPYDPKTGKFAKTDDPSTWGTLDQAKEAFASGDYDGVGLVMGKTTISGFDLDHVRDPETGEIFPQAMDLIDAVDSYTEVSPSGTGVHILYKGNINQDHVRKVILPEKYDGKNQVAFEDYDSQNPQYFTVTGNILRDKDISARSDQATRAYERFFKPYIKKMSSAAMKDIKESVQSEPVLLSAMSDEELLKRARSAKNGEAFSALYDDGDLSAYGNDASRGDQALINLLLFWTGRDPVRTDALFRQSALMRDKWDNRADYRKRTIAKGIESVKKGYTPYMQVMKPSAKKRSAVEKKSNPIVSEILEKLKDINALRYMGTDHERGYLYAFVFKDRLKWVGDEDKKGAWYVYGGKVWKLDKSHVIDRRFAQFLDLALQKYFARNLEMLKNLRNKRRLTDAEKMQKSYLEDIESKINRFGDSNVCRKMTKEAAAMMTVSVEDFDKDPYLVNFRNGILDLKTMKLLPHDSKYLITQMMRANYNSEAKYDRFNSFFEEIMQNDREKMDYVQKILGYSLLGSAPLEQFYIFYGAKTRNGKSTLLTTVQNVEGDYASGTMAETWAMKKNVNSSAPSPDLAKLEKARLCVTTEPNAKLNLNLALLKSATGNDELSSRQLFKSDRNWVAKFKLIFNTNHLPVFADTTLFDSRRVWVVEFLKHFEPEEIDTTLKEQFHRPEARDAIANFLVEGFKKYKNEGLEPPQCVKEATSRYQNEGDKLFQFLSEALMKSSESKLKAGDVFNVFKNWCEQSGYSYWGKQTFMAELRKRNLVKETATINGKTVRNVVVGYAVN